MRSALAMCGASPTWCTVMEAVSEPAMEDNAEQSVQLNRDVLASRRQLFHAFILMEVSANHFVSGMK